MNTAVIAVDLAKDVFVVAVTQRSGKFTERRFAAPTVL
jgi:hypothetical protein